MTTITGSGSQLARRLLATISAVSGVKAVLLMIVASVPAWRPEVATPWGVPADAWLPLAVLSSVLYAASGEAARRRRPGAFWFVAAVNTVGLLTGAQRLGHGGLSAVFFALSALLLVLLLLPPSRRALLAGAVSGP